MNTTADQSGIIAPAAIGRQVVADLWECDCKLLNDRSRLVELVRQAAEAARATVLDIASHQFEPEGVTALALLSESHISIHTWPEHGYAVVDILTCGKTADPHSGIEVIKRGLDAKAAHISTLPRGVRCE